MQKIKFKSGLALFLIIFILTILGTYALAAQTDKIKVFFNDPPDSRNIDIELANFIDSASISVYAHFYQLNRQCVIDSMVRAAKRLKPQNVKLITDNKYYKSKKYLSAYGQIEKAGIKIITDQEYGNSGNGESHNKFCIVDTKKIWTGSYNPTDNNTVQDYNNALIIENTDIAKLYNEEFSQMYDKNLFGAKKRKINLPRHFKVDSIEVEVYFSPTDDISSIITNYILSAQKFVSFVIFAFTDAEIIEAFTDRHKKGILVRGMCDNLSIGGKASGYKALKDRNMNIKQDTNSRSQLHDKFVVIDHESANSAMVITGSHNYTKAANTKNDENIVIIKDKYYAERYYNEFAKIYGAPQVEIAPVTIKK